MPTLDASLEGLVLVGDWGKTGVVRCSNKPPTLKQAQTIIEGFVEMAGLPHNEQLLVDEDGIAKNLPFNVKASMLANRPIYGRALLLHGDATWKD